MAEIVVHVRASRQQVVSLLQQIPRVATSSASDAAKQLLVRMGLALQGRIRQAFIVKSHGGTDDAGETWQKLSPRTIAYSRRHPGVPFPGKKRAPFAPSWMLTKKQRERWWKLYRQRGGTGPQGAEYHRTPNNPMAARIAWSILKSEGAKTLLGVYGGTQVDILRDKGLLLNSLSPGVPADSAGPSPPRVPNQVFRLQRGSVIVGTNRKWAATHHNGDGHVPQRRLWPPVNKWPSSWWSDVVEQGREGLIEIALDLLRKA